MNIYSNGVEKDEKNKIVYKNKGFIMNEGFFAGSSTMEPMLASQQTVGKLERSAEGFIKCLKS